MAGLAALAPYPQARHGRPLAAERVRSLLDVEVAPETRTAVGGCLDPRPDSTDESSKQVVVARSATHPALEPNGTPDGGVDRTTASRGFSLGRGAALFDPRSRCDLRKRGWRHDQRHGNRSRSHRSAISLVKSIRGTADRIHSPRVFGSRHRLERELVAPHSAKLF